MDPNNHYGQAPPPQPQPPVGGSDTPQNYPPTQSSYPAQPQQTGTAQSQAQPGSVVAQYPVDYLNQIATTPPVKKVSPVIIFGAIGAVIISAIVVLFMLIQSAAPPSATTQLYSLQARIATLDKLTVEQGKHLTQSDLSTMNTNVGVMLKSMSAQVGAYMKERGSASDKTSVAAKSAEKAYAEKLSTKLNNAYLTGTLDRLYASEMVYQLNILKSKLQSVKAVAKSKKFNEVYDNNVPSLIKISEKLSAFQNTK
jgi:hypothetical protein